MIALFLLPVFLRIVFYVGLGLLCRYIYKQIRIYRTTKDTLRAVKIGGLIALTVCLCVLGFSEPKVKPRIEMSTVKNMYDFLVETESDEIQEFDIGSVSGYTCVISEYHFESSKKDLYKCGTVDGIEVYCTAYECTRWETDTHLPLEFDFLGVPDGLDSAVVYLVSSDKVGCVCLDYNYYSVGMIFVGIVDPSFVYRPKIDFDDIISFYKTEQTAGQVGQGAVQYPE